MSNSINYKKIFNKINILTKQKLEKVSEDYDKCIYNSSIEILLYYDKVFNSIMISQLKLSENSDNYFSSCVIHRSSIEQFFRSYLIFFSTIKYGNKFAKIFSEDYSKNEMKNYVEKIKKYITEEKYESLKQILNIVQNDTPKAEINKLKWPNFLKELYSIESNEQIFPDKMIDQLIYQYAILSSFVHGGFDSIQGFYVGYYDGKNIEPKIDRILRRSLNFYLYNKKNIFILYDPMKETDIINELNKIQNEIAF